MSNEITAVTNQKGGVGKTTTTVNLGVALAMLGKKVLLVDGDPQGSLTISMGYRDLDNLTATLSQVMMAEIEDRSIPPNFGIIHHAEGIDLLPSNIDLSGVELRLVNTMSREQVLRSVLDRLRSQYDHILIDCMPSLGLMNINALAAADSVIIPLQPNYLSTKGLNLLLRSIARVRKQINPKLRIAGILFTMVDSRTNNANAMISQENKTEMTAAMRKGELRMENDNTYWTDDERNILRTKYYDGVPINEIALELGRSENAVYQQVIKMELYSVAPENEKTSVWPERARLLMQRLLM